MYLYFLCFIYYIYFLFILALSVRTAIKFHHIEEKTQLSTAETLNSTVCLHLTLKVSSYFALDVVCLLL